MARILSILLRVMLLEILVLITLQGVLTSDAPGVSEGKRGAIQHSSSASGSGGPAGPQPAEATRTKSRPKRCTCYSYKDKECVYYCHLDIIWINTPERTVPYGMSSYRGPQRIRRDVGRHATDREGEKKRRCVCVAVQSDPECNHFCLTSPLQTGTIRSADRVPGPG